MMNIKKLMKPMNTEKNYNNVKYDETDAYNEHEKHQSDKHEKNVGKKGIDEIDAYNENDA